MVSLVEEYLGDDTVTVDLTVLSECLTPPSPLQEAQVMISGRRTQDSSSTIEVSTILTPDEKLRVDAAGVGFYRTHHRAIPSEVIADIRNHTTTAVLISVSFCEHGDLKKLTSMVRELPRVPTIAVLTCENSRTPRTLLRLGQSGVHDVVDTRTPQGWAALRGVLSEQCADSVESKMLSQLKSETRMNDGCWLFFERLVHLSKRVSSVRSLATYLEVLPSTLMSRFFRAGLPAPKRYLAMARLLRAAYLFENRGFSIANVANHLEYSSPQSFGRHVRGVMHMTALNFRLQYRGDDMLHLFEQELIAPYHGVLRDFNPLTPDGYCSDPVRGSH